MSAPRSCPEWARAWESIKVAIGRERRAGRCKTARLRRWGDIVEDRQHSRCLPAAAPLVAAAPRPSSSDGKRRRVPARMLRPLDPCRVAGLGARGKVATFILFQALWVTPWSAPWTRPCGLQRAGSRADPRWVQLRGGEGFTPLRCTARTVLRVLPARRRSRGPGEVGNDRR